MGEPHYALSEAAIVVAAVWVTFKLGKGGLWLSSAGALLLGIAAAIGTMRFGLGLVEDLERAHLWASQTGGAAAMALIAIQCAMPLKLTVQQITFSLSLIAATILASALQPQIATPLFIAWSIVAILAAASRPVTNAGLRWQRAGAMAIFLFDALLIRRSAMLGPTFSWHLFHALIALWLLAVWWILTQPSTSSNQQETPKGKPAIRQSEM